VKKVNWLITDNTITVNYDGKTHIIQRVDDLGIKLIEMIKAKEFDKIPEMVEIAKKVEKFSDGNFIVKDGLIYIKGIAAPKVLGDKIVKFSNEGLPYEPLVKFAENLQKNPSYRAVNELYGFLENNNHPITENGNFIAYKKVRDDFKDVHSGTMDNSPGKVVEMPRNQVNEDCTQTCSFGLHAASYKYANDFYSGGKMLELEINPADVVSVPIDYQNSKLRVCKYLVLGVVDKESTDSSLRVVNQPVSQPIPQNTNLNQNYEEPCQNCGETSWNSVDVCADCGEERSDEYPYDDEF